MPFLDGKGFSESENGNLTLAGKLPVVISWRLLSEKGVNYKNAK